MTDRPSIFSAPMIRALLDGRKTQTRRVLKPPYGTLEYLGGGQWRPICTKLFPGDRLWVRETVALWTGAHRDTVYRADESAEEWANLKHDADLGFWTVRPSIHMPRWASRLTLIVTDVRVQRLQEISEDDAIAEGIHRNLSNWYPIPGVDGSGTTARAAFAGLWNSIHGPDAWDANPWVAAITFDVKRGNIDTPTGGTNDRS